VLAADQRNRGGRDAQRRREGRPRRLVGAAVDGWRRDAKLQRVAVNTRDFSSSRTRHDADRHDHAIDRFANDVV
jgi:hypothetical protein